MKCDTLEDVRTNIDIIDGKIVELLAQRGEYVAQVISFKNSVDEVINPKREEDVIAKVRSKAEALGANADMVESVYREIIASFTKIEIDELKDR